MHHRVKGKAVTTVPLHLIAGWLWSVGAVFSLGTGQFLAALLFGAAAAANFALVWREES